MYRANSLRSTDAHTEQLAEQKQDRQDGAMEGGHSKRKGYNIGSEDTDMFLLLMYL